MCEKLLTLIGDIYDAALTPSLWTAVLGRIREYVGGRSATIFVSGTDRYASLYSDEPRQADPKVAGFLAQIGVPQAAENFTTYGELMGMRGHSEWMRAQGLIDFATTVLDKSDRTVTLFGVFRDERHGPADVEMRRRMLLIAPHLRRAILLSAALDLTDTFAAKLVEALDRLSAGVILTDDTRAIYHTNKRADEIMAQGTVLRAVGGRLQAGDAQSDRVLRAMITAAVAADETARSEGVAQPLVARDGTRYIAHAMPLAVDERRTFARPFASKAVVFVHEAALKSSAALEHIARFYKLTPSEMRVMLTIADIGGTPESARALGISESTVRTHLQRIFAKTGTSRQADLVKLMAGFSHPLFGGRSMAQG